MSICFIGFPILLVETTKYHNSVNFAIKWGRKNKRGNGIFVLLAKTFRTLTCRLSPRSPCQLQSSLLVPLTSSSMIRTIGDLPRFVSRRISPAFSIFLSAVFLELPQTPHLIQFWVVTFMGQDVILWLLWPQSFRQYASLQMIIPITPAVAEIAEAFWNHFSGKGPRINSLYCREFKILLWLESNCIIYSNNTRVRVHKIWEVSNRTCGKNEMYRSAIIAAAVSWSSPTSPSHFHRNNAGATLSI